jgi:hypothetical protein
MDTFMTNANLAPSTKKIYMRILKFLNDEQDFTDLHFLSDYPRVVALLNKALGNKIASDNTVKSRLTAIISTLSRMGYQDSETYKFYRTRFDAIKYKIDTHLISGNKTAKEEANWVTQEELDKVYQDVKTKAENPVGSHESRLNYLLVSLYVDLPAARLLEYAMMKIVTGTPPKSLPLTYNWLLLEEKKAIINVHKNTTTKGSYTMSLSSYPKFLGALDLYMKGLNRKDNGAKYTMIPLLQNANGTAFERSDMIREKLNQIFKKNVGPGMLRKIQDSKQAEELGVNKDALEKMIVQAKAQGHSLETHARNYIKN